MSAVAEKAIRFQTQPADYIHWRLRLEPPIAYLTMDVDEGGGLSEGYVLKLNSYDLGVDIELYDATQRLRFEHPEIRAVVINSGKLRTFCAGANIRMLGAATHGHKVNFCKFTNETRNAIEDASAHSGQRYLTAINGTAAGGGYELALATEYILLVDDGNAAVSLPEVPILAVLPGTGGLTRLVDKRKVRRDLADVFCTLEEGAKGARAVDWRLVDEVVKTSKFEERVREKALEMAGPSDPAREEGGIILDDFHREIRDDAIGYGHLDIAIDRQGKVATFVLRPPAGDVPAELADVRAQGCAFWPLALARELDDALLHLRFNEGVIGTLVFKTEGDMETVAAYDALLNRLSGDWLAREILLYWKRTLKRLDVTSRTTFAFVEPGSCFCGFLAELLFATDRCYMFDDRHVDGEDAGKNAIRLSALNFGPLPMANGLTRLETRFLGERASVDKARGLVGVNIDAGAALEANLVTFAPDDLDWDDEIRLLLEERSSFSPDSLTGMEANLRFAGPETTETKIFGRLSAWQNWIFQRPNAVGESGALKRYGSGIRPEFNEERI